MVGGALSEVDPWSNVLLREPYSKAWHLKVAAMLEQLERYLARESKRVQHQ